MHPAAADLAPAASRNVWYSPGGLPSPPGQGNGCPTRHQYLAACSLASPVVEAWMALHALLLCAAAAATPQFAGGVVWGAVGLCGMWLGSYTMALAA